MATIQGVYVALFGRPADPAGLSFFSAATGNGADLTAIGDLSSTAEYQNRFIGQTSAQIVNSIFVSLFNRDADPAGVTFFVNELAAGRQTINTIAINILDGAQGADLATVNTKIAAADKYTARLDTPAETGAYQGDAAAALGRNFITPITNTVPTDAETDVAIAAMVAAAGPGPIVGETFTLTNLIAPPDNITGTENNDTFRAIVANALQTTDTLAGAGGDDVLNIAIGGLTAGASPVISGIERINNLDANKTLNLSATTGINEIWTNAAAAATTTTYTEAALATRFGYDATGFSATIAIDYRNADLAGATDTALLAANNAGTLATYAVAAADAPLIEAVNIAAVGPTGAAGTSFAAINSFTATASLTVTGAGNILVAGNTLTALATVDASATTGNVIINATGSTQNMTVTGGSGNGQFFTGSGNDILDGGLGADLYAGGAGADTYIIRTTTIEVAGNDSIAAANFVSGTDKLEFGGPAGSATNYVEVAVAGTDFLVARSAATTQLASNAALDYVAVQNAAGVLVFFDGDGDNALTTNGSDFAVLIQGITNAQIAQTDII